MLGIETYIRLHEEGKLPPKQYVIGGHIIQVCAAIFLIFGAWPIWQRALVGFGLLAYGEVVIQYGWPFYKKDKDT